MQFEGLKFLSPPQFIHENGRGSNYFIGDAKELKNI